MGLCCGHRWGRPRGLRGDNSIIRAAYRGSVGAVRHLLRTVPGAAAATGDWGVTALHHAAQWGHAELCRMLLAAGAVVDARERFQGLLAEDCSAGWKTFLCRSLDFESLLHLEVMCK